MTAATQLLDQPIVVFSQNYLPISRINLKRAINLLISGKAEPLDLFGGTIWQVRSPSTVLQVPEHIRLTVASAERVWKVPPVNRRDVFRRDHHTCQYCGSTSRLTIDHVIPLSQNGEHSWNNVVAACEPCNQRKGNRTPTQAQMPLRTQPKAPIHPVVAFAEQFWRDQSQEST